MSIPPRLIKPIHRPASPPAPVQGRAHDAGPGQAGTSCFLDKYGLIRDTRLTGRGIDVAGALDPVRLTGSLRLVIRWSSAQWLGEERYSRCPVAASDMPILDDRTAWIVSCRTTIASRCAYLLQSVDGYADWAPWLPPSAVTPRIPLADCQNLLVDSATGWTRTRVGCVVMAMVSRF